MTKNELRLVYNAMRYQENVEEAVRAVIHHLAQSEEKCPGCEATIKAACGRESCPKEWEESASVAYIRGLEDATRQERLPLTDEQIINEADRFDWDKDCAVRFARAIEKLHEIKE